MRMRAPTAAARAEWVDARGSERDKLAAGFWLRLFGIGQL